MSDNEHRTRELLESSALPIGEFIASVGDGLGEAQRDLDAGSAALFHQIYSQHGDEGLAALRDMGYQPNWYQIPELQAELKMALSISSSTRETRRSRTRLYAHSVDAGYSNQFDYKAEVSSKISFKVVPVPSPSGTLVPNLVGLTFSEAESRLATLGLVATLDDSIDLDKAAERIIGVQEPIAGTRVAENSEIHFELKK